MDEALKLVGTGLFWGLNPFYFYVLGFCFPSKVRFLSLAVCFEHRQLEFPCGVMGTRRSSRNWDMVARPPVLCLCTGMGGWPDKSIL